jgi:hypothetical protein
MAIAVIDWRPKRRLAMRTWLAQQSHEVFDVAKQSAFRNQPDVGLLLLHIGESQVDEGDNLADIVAEFCTRSWIVCYSGDPESIREFALGLVEGVAVFPKPVSADVFDDDFKKVLAKVLCKLPSRESIPQNWLRETVNGFNPELERRLEVLISVLSCKQPSSESLKATGVAIPAGELDLSNLRRSAGSLRKVFFGS